MSYTPTQWVTGDTVTAERLNNMENGIVANDYFVVNLSRNGQTYSVDKTASQINAAIAAGREPIIKYRFTNSQNVTYDRYFNIAQSQSPGGITFTRNEGNGSDEIIIEDNGSVSYTGYIFGSYSKPSGGIPEADLSNDVKTKLVERGFFHFSVSDGAASLLEDFSSLSFAVLNKICYLFDEDGNTYNYAGSAMSTPEHDALTFSCVIGNEVRTVTFYDDGTGSYYEAEIPQGAFIIQLTPTAQDFSGVMDQSLSDIYAAFINGQQIVFSIPSMGSTLFPSAFVSSGNVVVCQAQFFYDVSGAPVLINLQTDTTGQTYSTEIFSLTPMS